MYSINTNVFSTLKMFKMIKWPCQTNNYIIFNKAAADGIFSMHQFVCEYVIQEYKTRTMITLKRSHYIEGNRPIHMEITSFVIQAWQKTFSFDVYCLFNLYVELFANMIRLWSSFFSVTIRFTRRFNRLINVPFSFLLFSSLQW